MMECRNCHKQKEESAFKKRSSSKTGYVSTCKRCAADYSKSKGDKWPIEFWACGVTQEEPN